LVAWDTKFFNLALFLTCGGILLSGFCLKSQRQLNLLNVYDPFSERNPFWEKMASSRLLNIKSLILAGDLNDVIF